MNEFRRRKPSHISSTSTSIELPPYSKTPPSTTSHDLTLPFSPEEEISHNSSINHTTKSLHQSPDFHGLLVTNERWLNLSLTPLSNPSTPLYYITNTTFSLSTPSVVLSQGSKAGPVLGILNILWARANPFALTPSLDPPPATCWESLQRTSKWKHSTYEFPWEGKVFVWERTRCRWLGDQPDLELREKADGGVGGRVWAVYRGEWDWKGKRRGCLFLRRSGSGPGEVLEGEKGGEWEQVVVLTACGIIEAARRRARARRNNGGGGGGC